ncbi:MAG TPA: polysaccharide biosynthesis/export family protein [Terriglobales bacterium]|nr:polysaccharide biosynthesis/export family protein [Terriglobales bacterium]
MRIGSLFILAAALIAGAPAARSQTAPQTVAQTVGPGDVLAITVYAGGEKQEDFESTISPRGTILCPLLGEFQTGSAQTTEIAAHLREALGTEYYNDPQVLITVRTFGGKVFLLGEVRRPGTYTLSDAPTVLSACASAGGWTDFASPHRVRITRIQNGRARVILVDLLKVRQGKAADVPLQVGDHIEVPRRVF